MYKQNVYSIPIMCCRTECTPNSLECVQVTESETLGRKTKWRKGQGQ